LRVAYGTPIGFMLASPIFHGETYGELAGASWLIEDKYDGIRAQAHVRNGSARIFSRRLNDVSAPYPEVVAALPEAVSGDAILDGEILAMRDGRVLPFRTLQARLQRKDVDGALLREVPVAYVAFDVLAAGDELLLDEPLVRRRERLAALLTPDERVLTAPYALADGGGTDVNARFEAARERGNEGLVVKRADSPYAPGRRGKWWLKLKRELATLDVAVVAVEWGHGKRARVLSDYTFAVRDGERLLAIGKAYSGLTDAEIADLTPWFLEHRLPAEQRRPKSRASEIPVEPKIVIEVAFDVVARSELHESGFALRFPRIVRVRDDKPPAEIDTLDRVRDIYEQMLARESPASP
jgi:DNA ligase-1